MIRLIVSADDVGLAPGITDGALQAFDDGIVTSVSVLTATPDWAETAAKLTRRPKLDIGVHLTLCEGQPVAPASEVALLLGPDRLFPKSLSQVTARALRARAGAGRGAGSRAASSEFAGDWIEQVAIEWRAQVQRALDAGLEVSHVDGHKHVHLLPGLAAVAADVARSLGVGGIRAPAWFSPRRRPAVCAGLTLRSTMARRLPAVQALRTPDRAVGVDVAGALTLPTLLELLDRLKPGVTELCAHPGLPGPDIADELARSGMPWGHSYQFGAELAALTSPEARARINKRGIELIGYRQL